jgi:transcription termination/antitermination protein NusA
MSKITYNAELLKIMTLFETITRSRVKDAFVDDNNLLTFVVSDVEIGKAIGKNAANVKRLENMLKRKIKIVAFNPSATEFVKNLVYPVTNIETELVDKTIMLKGPDAKTKGFLIGRNQSNIKNTLNIVKKYFKDIENIKVV